MYESGSEQLLSRSAKTGAQGPDPIQMQRRALFGDDSGAFAGTLEELSRTKRRQKQRARELLFGDEPELFLDGPPEAYDAPHDAPETPRVWVGFEEWQPSGTPDEPPASAADEPPNAFNEPPVNVFKESTAEPPKAYAPPHAKARAVPDGRDGFYAAQFEKLGVLDANDARRGAISHRWTLEELWSFSLKLDRLERMLETAPPAPETPAQEVTPPSPEATTPDPHTPPDAPEPPFAPETPTTPQTPIAPPNAPLPTPPNAPPPNISADGLPKGRTPEETFAEAMELVERGAVSPKPPRSAASRIILALIGLGALALVALGAYHLMNINA